MKLKKTWYLILIGILLASIIGILTRNNTETTTTKDEETIETPNTNPITTEKWWEKAVFYQIFPRSFQDSDGDGIGDFKGMTSRLDYLQELGITAIWLTPVFEAPSYHGYDFEQFYEVESDYGTMEDLEEFLAEAEKRGIKVIADLVLNHISNNHQWFKQSVAKETPYTNYFIWEKTIPEGKWGKPWALTGENGFNQPEWVWIYNEDRGEYYYAAFDGSQPDLNLENPQVFEEIEKITKFWIDKGFDGFRLDAIRYAVETGGYPNQADTPETLDFWIKYNDSVKAISPDILLIGEIWASNQVVSQYYENTKGIDQGFDFDLGNQLLNALNGINFEEGFGESTSFTGRKTLPVAVKDNFNSKANLDTPMGFYAPFLGNHDRPRVMYQLNNNTAQMKIAAVVLFTSIGTPYIYYGEEIGMTQTNVEDHQFQRAPMQWDDSDFAGFTTGGNVWVDDGKWFPWREVHSAWWKGFWDSFDSKSAQSVAGQKEDSDSLLNLYKMLIKIRKENPEFQSLERNSKRFFDSNSENVLAFQRVADTGETSIIIINGSTTNSEEADINYLEGKSFINLLNGEEVTFDNGKLTLNPGEFFLLKEKN